MTQLIKNIEAIAYTQKTGSVTLVKSIYTQIQREDYINLNGLIMCLQNFSAIEDTSRLTTPLMFGLFNKNNIKTLTLEIDY
jgi:hypothetical protein